MVWLFLTEMRTALAIVGVLSLGLGTMAVDKTHDDCKGFMSHEEVKSTNIIPLPVSDFTLFNLNFFL